MKQVKSNLSGIFMSSSARNKKYDGDKSAFNFSEIQNVIKSKSLQQLMEHESFPIILICFVLGFITIIYIIIASFSTAFILNNNNSDSNISSSLPMHPQYDNELIIEIEEVLSKIMDLRKKGNMKDYEAFLQPTMQIHCLDHLGKSFLNVQALESFHMNLAETISFVSAGNVFTEHEHLMVTSLGGIIDPKNSKESQHIIDTAKACPLLTALHELGATKQSNKANTTEKDGNSDTDSDEKFDQEYSWQNMEEFMNLMYSSISKTGQCLRIAKELSKDNLKIFIMNFYEMADIIGKETAKEEADGAKDLGNYYHDPNSPDYKKYVIGRDGGVYETDKYDDTNDEYIRCPEIERILNDKFMLDDNLSYTNVKIAIDETFDEWYIKMQGKLGLKDKSQD